MNGLCSIVLVSGLAFVFSGCTLAPKLVHLERMPAVADIKFTKPACVVISNFKDERVEPEIIGHTYNLGVKTSDVKTSASMSNWIQESYETEFKEAGATNCESDNQFVVTGTIRSVSQQEAWNINSSIQVELKLEGKGVSYEQLFEGQSSQISHEASNSEFTDSLYKAVQDLMKKSVPVIVTKAESLSNTPQ